MALSEYFLLAKKIPKFRMMNCQKLYQLLGKTAREMRRLKKKNPSKNHLKVR
jgi:hypothetical protein